MSYRMKTKRSVVLVAVFLFSQIYCIGADNIKTAANKPTKFPKAQYRGFTIPQIDLNNRADLQVTVSRDPKVYMGHPSSVLLDDGKSMVMMYLNRHGKGRLMWRRSKDGGYSWSGHLPVPEGWDEPVVIKDKKHPPFLEVPILYRVKDQKGKDRIFVYTAGRGSYPARYAFSQDGGETWSTLQPIMFDGKELFGTVVLFSDMIKLKNGSYMATWHNRGKVYTAATKDGFAFSAPRPAVTHKEAHPCEGCFIRSPNGKKIALLLRENKRIYNSLICFSEDEGKTWSEPKQLPDSLTGDRHQHTYTPDGRLFISLRDRGVETPSFGDWVGWVGTFEDLEENRQGQY
jgi:hypothetical protein